MPTAVDASGLEFSYPGGGTAVHGIDLVVPQGQFCALAGPNGSGKSTLVRLLLGLLRPDTGEIRLFDTPLEAFRAWSRIGYVPQRPVVDATLPATVAEVVASGLAGRDRSRQTRRSTGAADAVAAALAATGLGGLARRRAGRLSGGESQRMFLARALAASPDLLVLDEPTAGVDAASLERFLAVINALHADHHTTVILITHGLPGLEGFVDRVVALEGGRVAGDAPTLVSHPLPGRPVRAPPAHPRGGPGCSGGSTCNSPGRRVSSWAPQPPSWARSWSHGACP